MRRAVCRRQLSFLFTVSVCIPWRKISGTAQHYFELLTKSHFALTVGRSNIRRIPGACIQFASLQWTVKYLSDAELCAVFVYCVLFVSVLIGSIIVCGDGENGDKFVEDITTRCSSLLTANKVNGAFLSPMTRSEKSEVSYKIDCFLFLKIVGRFAVISAIGPMPMKCNKLYTF